MKRSLTIIKAATLFTALLCLGVAISHALKAPHNASRNISCSSCHTMPGFRAITSEETFCFSVNYGCHNADKTGPPSASKKRLSLLDRSNRFNNLPSVPGAKQTSHGWKIPNNNPDAGASNWGISQPFSYLTGKVYCSRCHIAHGETLNPKFLRDSPRGDKICFNCHGARRVGEGSARSPLLSGKHYSHPVEVNYSSIRAARPDFFETNPLNPYSLNPSAALKLFTTSGGVKGAVICQTCHGPIHSSDSNPYTFDNITTYSKTGNYSTSEGNLLRRYPATKSNDLCQSCHKVQSHRDFLCSRCHAPHKKANEYNRYLIHENISTPSSGKKAVLFTSTSQMAGRWQDNSQPTPICQVCHTQTRHHRNYSTNGADREHNYLGNGKYKFCAATCHKHTSSFSHGAGGSGKVEDCLPCHGHDAGYTFNYNGKDYTSEGRGNYITHSTHTENDVDDQRGPNVFCDACHDINNMPYFKSGTDTDGNGKIELSETDVCNTCHSPGGTFNGVNSQSGSVGAKDYFKATNGAYSNGGIYNNNTSLKTGMGNWCIGCHDESPSTIGTETAPNKMGDNSTYGFFINGHGKASGNYSKLSHQDSTATGNPAANKNCAECHNSTKSHIVSGGNPSHKRLRNVTNNDSTDQINVCNLCHITNGSATAAPFFYMGSGKYNGSAHKDKKCTECHDVHGSNGAGAAMTKKSKETLCYDCHKGGVVRNDAISGFGLASSIKQAFSYGGHPLGQSFPYNGQTFNLQCTSCHNVHVVTGKYWDAAANKSPITKFSNNTAVWGDKPGQKMSDYAGGGTYRTPNGDPFSGSQLPDYATFCLDCHGQPVAGWQRPDIPSPKFDIDWNGDPHGKQSANNPNGYGTCPNWFACGNAFGWDGDVCTGSQSECWPVKSKGAGDELYSREAYTHTERVAGANFTMACIDCHEAHGSGIGSMIRPSPNGFGQGSTTWNYMCNNCHYYYSDWHAGMSCGTASCHEASSLHRMKKNTGSGTTRTVDQSLVVNYAFENDLNDSSGGLMNGQWMDGLTGSFAAGKVGQAAVFDGGKNVQVGTTNGYWSTDEGNHGTWKYTEMKYNTTLEAWVYPTDSSKSEYSIFTKHTGYTSGGYSFALRKIDNILRPAFIMQADNNSFTLGGNAGVRGAYGATGVPLNTWTHVAVTLDTAGPDGNAGDLSIGRIRIYLNGVDVTTSSSSGDLVQPGANETSIFAYSENSNYNEAICYNGSWCASEFSIGGFYGWQSAFVGRIDEAKVWNITKASSYFTPIDQSTAPTLVAASWDSTLEKVLVTFTEGVYTTTGASGALTSSDFSLASAGGRTITGVTHTAGSYSAQLSLSSPLDASTINVATVAAASATAIYDKYNNAAGTTARTITGEICPSYPVTFDLNESGTSTIKETQNVISGTAYQGASTTSTTVVSGGVFTGNGPTVSAGSGNYYNIKFNNNLTCLGATTGVSIEARIKPTGIPADSTTYYTGRIFGKWNDTDNTISHQLSVWRQPGAGGFANYSPPSGVASIALWVKVSDMHATTNYRYKPVLTEATNTASGEYCRIENNHWYYVKATFNTNKPGGTTGQPFVPGDIYVEDQGTDGAGAGKNWTGLKNCTDADQSQFSTPTASDNRKLYTGDVNVAGTSGRFTIGADPACTTTGCTTTTHFNGSIDYITINEMPPSAPAIGTATSLSPYSIRWNFTDTADTEDGFSVHDSSDAVKATSATQNLTYLDEGSLSPNTQYTRHVHAYNTGGDSLASANASRYTLSVTPNVTSDKAVSTWYGTPDVVFTNAAGFGAGGVQYFRYAWNQSATYTFNDTETQWSTGTHTKTATAAGMWYLHVKAFNADNVANGTQTYGPYYYNTPPTVVATLPDNGTTGVALNGTVNITWSQDVNCATVNTTNITISGGGWALSSCSGNEAVFATSGQSGSTTYTVNVTTAVTDATGNPMAANYPFSYTTAP